MWFTDTVTSAVVDGGKFIGWGGPSIANLDLDPEPEIVVAGYNSCLCVFEADGTLVFDEPLGPQPTVPALADITGDGFLDILVAQDETLTLYDYANSMAIVWTRNITPALGTNSWGAPAVADVDGLQPGGDPGPEIAIGWDDYVELIDDDGSLIWSFATNPNGYRPSHVAIADTDGDGEVEVIVDLAISSGFVVLKHTLYVLNADGTLLWERDVIDNTGSSSGVSVHDLDGDGDYEVMWNGSVQGYSVFDGGTGKLLFNEPFINSGTVLDYPAIADVDGDGYTEVIMGDSEGIYVVGHDGIWAPARPMWNSHDYHVTNINDDWSVPVNEPPSWLVHNTYRTQTPLSNPTPSYQVEITYTAAISGVAVLTGTFSRPAGEAPPDYQFAYQQEWYQEQMTTTFSSLLEEMRPGEVRQVSQGTEVRYQLPSGINRILLPPLFVTAARIIELSPPLQRASAGGLAEYQLSLINADLVQTTTYTLTLSGLAAEWHNLPMTISLAPGATKSITMAVQVAAGTPTGTLPFSILARDGDGGSAAAVAELEIVDGVDVSLAPAQQGAPAGKIVTMTLQIDNLQGITGTFIISASGLAQIELPPPVEVAPGGSATVVLSGTATGPGPNPFTISVTDPDSGAADSVDGLLERGGAAGVIVDLSPDPASAGPSTPAVLTATVTNLGSIADSYDLSVTVPAGWSHALNLFGVPAEEVTVPPGIFNSTSLILVVTPDESATPGDYEITFATQSQSEPAAGAFSTATVQVLERGVAVEFVSGSAEIGPSGEGSWQVRIRNTGAVADTYDLSAAGIMATTTVFTPASVTLAAGQFQDVTLSATDLDFLTPGIYTLVAAAQSTSVAAIANEDSFTVTVQNFEGVEVTVAPSSRSISDTLSAVFNVAITNTGNMATNFDLTLSLGLLAGQLAVDNIRLAPHQVAQVPVTMLAPSEGSFPFTVTAVSSGATVSDSDSATLIVGQQIEGLILYLPVILNN